MVPDGRFRDGSSRDHLSVARGCPTPACVTSTITFRGLGQYQIRPPRNLVLPLLELPPQVAAVLVKTPEAQLCMSRKWIEYAVGRDLTAPDSAAVDDAHRWFAGSGFNLRELIAGVTQTYLFLTNPPLCTPGLDQTCNDNPIVSSFHGHCTEALRCVCGSGCSLNATTGRCL